MRGPAHRARQLTEALLVYGLGLALTTGSLAALEALAPGAGRPLQVLALIGATALSGLVRFILLRGWVFHPGRDPPVETGPGRSASRRHFSTSGPCGIIRRMQTNTSTPGGGVELRGLAKSFSSPTGPVHAVRGVDVAIAPGETVALLGPNGAGKSTTIDMMLGLMPPDRGTVTVFGRPPAEAIASGAVGAMLQTGSLIRDLSVRELVEMMASLYPHPLGVDEVIELTGIGDVADRRTQRLSGGETQRARFAVALVANPDLLVLDEPTVAMDVEGRLSFWATMRDFAARGKTVVFATHYLEEADANADRAILMAGGRIVADGPTTEIKAMVGSRTIRATLPGADLAELGSPARGHPAPTATARPSSCVCSDSDAAIRALLAAHPEARDIEITGAGLEQAFLQLTAHGGEDGGRRGPPRARGGPMNAMAYTRFEVLRTFRNTRFFIFSLGFPLVLYFLIAGPNKGVDDLSGSGISAPLYFMVGLTAFGTMTAVLASGARIAGERAVGWNRQLRITPLTTRAYFRAKVATGYLMATDHDRAALRLRDLARGEHARRTVARDDRLHPHRPDPLRAPRRPDGARPERGLRRPGDGRRDGHLRAASAARGSRSARACSTTSGRPCPRTGWCRRATSRWAATSGASPAGWWSGPGPWPPRPSPPGPTSGTPSGSSRSPVAPALPMAPPRRPRGRPGFSRRAPVRAKPRRRRADRAAARSRAEVTLLHQPEEPDESTSDDDALFRREQPDTRPDAPAKSSEGRRSTMRANSSTAICRSHVSRGGPSPAMPTRVCRVSLAGHEAKSACPARGLRNVRPGEELPACRVRARKLR